MYQPSYLYNQIFIPYMLDVLQFHITLFKDNLLETSLNNSLNI